MFDNFMKIATNISKTLWIGWSGGIMVAFSDWRALTFRHPLFSDVVCVCFHLLPLLTQMQ